MISHVGRQGIMVYRDKAGLIKEDVFDCMASNILIDNFNDN